MPSATFFRLAPEKQERLLTAATREFSRRPFSEASINQIIKDAGIPRGSFYMYFADKEDLFRYVMEGYVDQLLLVVRESILRCGGDLFEGMLRLYDYVQSRRQEQQVGQMGTVTTIIACNSGLQQNMLLGLFHPPAGAGCPGRCGGGGPAGSAMQRGPGEHSGAGTLCDRTAAAARSSRGRWRLRAGTSGRIAGTVQTGHGPGQGQCR